MIDDVRRGLPSASAMGRVIACPASVERERGRAEEKSEVAESGTRLHAALQGAIDHTTLSEHESYLVRASMGIEEAIRESLGFGAGVFGVKTERERRYWLDPTNKQDVNTSGQLDVAFRKDNRVLIIDYKGGRREVAMAWENWQMATLAVLYWTNHNLATAPIDEIHVAVIQPLVKPDRTIARYTPKEIREAGREIVAALRAAKEPDAPAAAGEHCYYCRARGECPEALAFSKALVRTDEVQFVKSGRKTEVLLPAMTPEQLLHAYELKSTIERITKAIGERFKESVAAGEQPDYEMGKGSTLIDIRNPVTVFKRLRDHIPIRRLLSIAKFSMDDMDQLVGNVLGISKDKARAFWVPTASDGLEANEGAPQVRKKKV